MITEGVVTAFTLGYDITKIIRLAEEYQARLVMAVKEEGLSLGSLEEVKAHLFQLYVRKIETGIGSTVSAFAAKGFVALVEKAGKWIVTEVQQTRATEFLAKKGGLTESEAQTISEAFSEDDAKLEELYEREYKAYVDRCEKSGGTPEDGLES